MTKPTQILIALLIAGGCSASPVAADQGTTRTLNASRGGTLDVVLNGGDIQINTWDRSQVVVTAEEGDEEDGEEPLDISQQGNTIRVRTGHGGNGSPQNVSISIPWQFTVRVETNYGEINVTGKLRGNIDAETNAGGIHMDEVEGTVNVRTSGGDITTGAVTGDATLNTSGGDIHVASTTGELDVRTAGGDIHLGNVGKSLRANTSGGDVIIGSVGGEVNISTSGGNIRTGRVSGTASLKTSGGDIDLNGGTGMISAATSGGNVAIHNVSGSVDARSSGGDISAELVPSGKGRSRLSTAAGNISLYLPDNARATIDARIRIQGWGRGRNDDYRIDSDFKADRMTKDENGREITGHYTLNGGGEQITLETVNSDIFIKNLKKSR